MYAHGTNSDVIEIYHNPGCSKTKSAVAYARSMVNNVMEYEYAKHQTTATQWRDLLSKLGKSPRELIDEDSEYYRDHLEGKDFDDSGWIMVLIKDPQVIRGPIAVRGDRAVFLESAADIRQL
ncbi:MAG: hypothetical protein H6606_08275 [Flavobacteriales bacterium]|nr:hypothetical protein [Flavobacteriales bacterium]